MLRRLRMLHLFFIFPCIVLPYRYPASRIHTDEAALLRFKEEIVHDPQGFLANWNETIPLCEWNGVVCTDDGEQVSKLLFKSKFLEGTISPFLSNLTALACLELSENSLVGPIPAELGTLQSLELLGMQGNKLKGEIPSSFGQLSNLKYIDLSKNKLSGPLPSILYNCTQLVYVDLSSNMFTGSIPSQMGESLPYLENLLLYFNHLSGTIPTTLSNSTRMVELDLENNFLTGTLPSEIVGGMPMLKILHLSYNHLSSNNDNNNLSPFFTAISNLTHLEELELAGNSLAGEIPSTIGLLHVNISQIHLEDNLIYGVIPITIANLSSLTLLNLSNNNLNGTIPSEISLLPKLERLCLSKNSLQGEIPTNIGALNHLGLLDLSQNMLTGPIPTSLENVTQLRKLVLSANNLSGIIPPRLGRCVNLELLDLSHNALTGNIPAQVAGLSNIAVYFNLSNNQLTGEIPMELGRMERVWEIDLSSNNLTGEIPSSVGRCQEVGLLNLSRNSLTGKVPATLGNLLTLKYLDLSTNSLSGEIPEALGKCSNLVQLNLSFNNFSGSLPTGGVFDYLLSYETIKDNSHICGSLSFLPSCVSRKSSTVHSRKFFIAIVAFVSISAFLLTICCVITARRMRFLYKQRERDPELTTTSVESVASYPRITYRELWEATGGFEQSRLIGSGGFGHVYRGILRDGTVVAIKVLQLQARNSSRSFSRECQVLKRIRHRNLIRIITACSLPDFKALVLPFMANGNLENHLYPRETNPNMLTLSLIERLHICSDIAEGMAYLHHHSPVQVIHCDLKPSNVLLNDEMTALVADFGISRLITKVEGTPASETMNSTANLVVGSLGYVAPEYGFGRGASTKGDVYSFGILLLELVTRKKPTDDLFHEGINLPTWVRTHYHNGLDKIIDPFLMNSLWHKNQETKKIWEFVVVELVEIGLHCAQESPSTRPTMVEVAEDLDRLKRHIGGDTTATLTSSQGVSSSTITGVDDW